jgi:excisionase family DNA binding protein
MPDPQRPLVSIQTAMSIADVSRRTIYNWMAQGKLAYVRTAGGSVRIVAASLFRAGDGVTTVQPTPIRETAAAC